MHKMMTKSNLISTVIKMIEESFPRSVVVWSREGYPEHNGEASDIQVFEAYDISEDEYVDFMNFVRTIKRTVARPNGFEIMVHDLTMEETAKYRSQRYQEGLIRRELNSCWYKINVGYTIETHKEWKPLPYRESVNEAPVVASIAA